MAQEVSSIARLGEAWAVFYIPILSTSKSTALNSSLSIATCAIDIRTTLRSKLDGPVNEGCLPCNGNLIQAALTAFTHFASLSRMGEWSGE